jgi:hypothetical protein
MSSPEVARALPELVRDGLLTPEQAAPLAAAARGEVVSVRAELRTLLGAGVLALTGAAGLLLERHFEAIGPRAVAVALAAALAGCLLALERRAPPFTWRRAEEPDWIVDGLLLLAIGLLGAELAWLEVQFAALGPRWPWHLLVMSLLAGAAAIRYDSRVAWSLALSTFAAWRGVALVPSASSLERTLLRGGLELRLNLLLCGVVFVALGRLAERSDRKAHFEPASTLLGALAAGLACASGLGESASWPGWAAALALVGGGVAAWAFRRRRLALFALGALGIYVAGTRFLLEIHASSGIGCFWFAASTIGAIVLLVVVQRRFQAGERG